MPLQARLKAHDWVSKVEEPVTTETVGTETPGRPGAEASPGESEEEETKKEVMEGGEEEEEKERDPRSVEVSSTHQLSFSLI